MWCARVADERASDPRGRSSGRRPVPVERRPTPWTMARGSGHLARCRRHVSAHDNGVKRHSCRMRGRHRQLQLSTRSSHG